MHWMQLRHYFNCGYEIKVSLLLKRLAFKNNEFEQHDFNWDNYTYNQKETVEISSGYNEERRREKIDTHRISIKQEG